MTTCSVNRWQIGKSMVECNSYMFTHQVACDVHFHLRHPEHESEEISAHKYILISRSPVFYAMLCGELATDNVDIVDIEPAIFKQMLKYLYQDRIDLTAASVFYILHAAKKYAISSLEGLCRDYLTKNISNDTVCVIYDQSRSFDEVELEATAQIYIDENAEEVFDSEAVFDLSYDSLSHLLKSSMLEISESLLIRSVFRWAESQCKRRQMEVSGNNKRAVLKDILFDLRFPLLSLKSLTEFSDGPGILTSEDIGKIFSQKFCSPTRRIFSSMKRSGAEPRQVFICDNQSKTKTTDSHLRCHFRTSFQTDCQIEIVGLKIAKVTGLRSSYDYRSEDTDVYLNVEMKSAANNILHQELQSVFKVDSHGDWTFTFQNPVQVSKGEFHISTTYINKDTTYYRYSVHLGALLDKKITSRTVTLSASGEGAVKSLLIRRL